ncbi:hypothetical protein JCM30760_26340 [Thiomicrorhabdus hydrogeniphila]
MIIEINPQDITVELFSSKKRGAWSVEKDKGVRITHLPSGIRVETEEFRSQHRNRAKAMLMLQEALENLGKRILVLI